MGKAEEVVDQGFGGPFCGGGLEVEGLLTLVLVVLEDKATDIGRDEHTLCTVKI